MMGRLSSRRARHQAYVCLSQPARHHTLQARTLILLPRRSRRLGLPSNDHFKCPADLCLSQISENFRLNGMIPPHHFPHTWGVAIPENVGAWDVIVASDILLYVKAYPALVSSLEALLAPKARARTLFWRWQPADPRDFLPRDQAPVARPCE